jgi:quercetin dioxygenase-like cupin family protein
MIRVSSFAVFAILVISVRIDSSDSQEDKHDNAEMKLSVFLPKDMKWVDGPPSLPRGAKIAVLEGDTNKNGPFVFRAKLPDGYVIPPHTHPNVERITVVSGVFCVGMGDRFDRKKTVAMPAGTFGFWPAGMKHFVTVDGETVIQFHGTGPWSLQYVNPEDDPRRSKQ